MEPAGGMELLTLNSINSQKNPSQVSLYLRDAIATEMDEDSWSWSYLRDQFRIKDLEGLYLRYQRRLQHAYFSIFLMLQLVIGLTHMVVLLCASDSDVTTVPDVIAYGVLSLVCLPMIITTYSEKILRNMPWLQLVMSAIVVFVLLTVDIGLPLFHNLYTDRKTPYNSSTGSSFTTLSLESVMETEVEKSHLAELESMSSEFSVPITTSKSLKKEDSILDTTVSPANIEKEFLVVRPVYAGYTLLACYVFLPLPENKQALITGLFVTVAHLVFYGIVSYKNTDDAVPRVIADTIFLVCLNLLGLYLRFVNEVMIRRTFLDRRACIKCTNMLKYEKEQEEQLMLSILPSHIAAQVKEDIRKIFHHIQKHHTTPIRKKPFSELYVERHKNVSILYADVVNFTQLTESLPVNKLVETLNELFSNFDEASKFCHIAGKPRNHTMKNDFNLGHGSFKQLCITFSIVFERDVLRIKFLGDCYYCVAGIPQPKPNLDHARSCVELGLDMIAIIKDVREDRGVNVDMRIGVHSGRILSGLLGVCKWQFDIWSLDVEIANHMEQSGEPGKVHITKQTQLHLGNSYHYEAGNGARRDAFLAKNKIETFLISPVNKQEENRRRAYSRTLPNRRASQGLAKMGGRSVDYYKAKRGLSTSEGMPTPRRRMVFMDDNVLLYREMQKKANDHMAEAIEKMPLGKYDQWFQGEQIHPLLLTFENSKWELPFFQQPDPLFKFYVACATPLILGMLLLQGVALPRWPSGVLWICFGLTSFLLLLFLVLPLFWAQLLWSMWQDPRGELEEPVPPPTQPFLSSCYSASSYLVQSTTARVSTYLLVMLCLSITPFSHLAECKSGERNHNLSSSSYIEDEEDYKDCSPPWQITETCALTVMMNFLFLKIHFGLKLFISTTITLIYSWIVWDMKAELFQSGETSNPTLDPRIAHIMYIIFFSLSMHLMDRQVEYMNRLDYKWKRKLFEEQDEASTTRMVNKMLLQNILPIHVAEIYLNTNRATELYYEEYDSVSVMFASIVAKPVEEEEEEEDSPDQYSSEQLEDKNRGQDDGYASLQLLNEIICVFDKLLFEPSFMRVEKIKVAGWTYLAGCGLQPGRRDSGNSDRSVNRSEDVGLGEELSQRQTADNILVLVRFAASMMEVLHKFNKDAQQGLQLRVGIQHGPVMAGVVGAHKPLYDIWGDTVNVASRLDSSGEPGKIQITQETAMVLLKHGVQCERRGMTNLKGKGPRATYYVCLDKNYKLIFDKKEDKKEDKNGDNSETREEHVHSHPEIVIHQPIPPSETSNADELSYGPPRGDSGFAEYEQVVELIDTISGSNENCEIGSNELSTKL